MGKTVIGAAILAAFLGMQEIPACSRTKTDFLKMEMKEESKNMRAYQEPAMEKGPLLFPKKDLLAAFEASYGKGIRWKLPVLVHRDDLGQVKQSQVGLENLGSEKDRLPIYLNDSGLGISLHDRLEQNCGQAQICTIWLIGRWQKPMLGMEGKEIEFFIEAVVGQPEDFSPDADAACVYKEVI